MLADLAYAIDRVAFAGSAGFRPDPWQADVLASNHDRLLLNCSRQSGKSTVTGLIATWTALFEPGSLTLMLSPSLRQSGELFRKALDVYRTLGRPVAPESENRLSLELENGSRIVSLPGKEATIRGFSGVGLLITDEASRVDDELYRSVRPMLAVSGGRLIALSTPWGKRGWWHDAWTNGGDRWKRVEVPATMCPRISAEFLAEERQALGDLFYRSEYLCEFVDNIEQLFRYEDVIDAITVDVQPLFGGSRD